MAVERAKVIAALNTMFKGKSVSKELKEAYATRWADKIEDEEGMQVFLDDRSDDVLDAAKEADRRAQAAAVKAKNEAADLLTGKKPDEKKVEEPEVDPNMPVWAKALMDGFKSVNEEFATMKQAKSAQTIAEKFAKDERLKGVPEKLLAKWTPTSDDDFETAVTDLSEFVKESKIQTFIGKDMPGGAGTVGPTDKDGKVNPAIQAFAKAKVEEFKSSSPQKI